MISFLKKTLKVIFWVIISFVLLFITVAILIQIPAIQTKIVHYATSFVSNKTHTRVEIKNISIGFPKSIVIEGLFLEDKQKDTLVYAGRIKVNVAFTALFHKEIRVSSFAMDDVNVNMNRPETDSLFNYNFLITAFSDTTKQPKVAEPSAKSKWTFVVDDVSLKNIRFHYNDDYGGTNIAVKLKEVKLNIDKIDLPNLTFAIDKIRIENLTAGVLISKSGKASSDTSQGKLPIITVADLQLNNSFFTFGDSVGKLSILANVNALKLKKASVDLPKENISLKELFLSKSDVHLSRAEITISDTSSFTKNANSKTSNWIISAKNILFDDNSLAYIVTNKPEAKNTFDANHLIYKHVNLNANDLYYSASKIMGSVRKLQAVDHNNFSITKFETDFVMDQYSIIAKSLKASTTNSLVDADLSIKYSSLNSLKDSLPFMMVAAEIRKAVIRNSDIIYFAPQLIKQTFFKNSSNITSVSGLVNGSLNNLVVKNLEVKTGAGTTVATDIKVTGLPDFNTAWFDIPDMKLHSDKTDIMIIAGNLIPATIDIPENISMQIMFKGKIKDFMSTIDMNSSFGNANIVAAIDSKENFKSNVSLSNFDIGSLLKNKPMLGTVSLHATLNGHGFSKQTLTASINANASQFYLNKYNYHDLTVEGTITGQQFEGKINLNDENAKFTIDGLANIDPDNRHYKFNLNVLGADLQKLNLSKDDIRIGFMASADLKSDTSTPINGNARINNVIAVWQGKQYILDSLLIASVNEPNTSKVDISKALIGLRFNGTVSPVELPKVLASFINNYFLFSDSVPQKDLYKTQKFNFELQIRNHPIISEVFLPEIKEFDPVFIQGSFDSQKDMLKLDVTMKKLIYGTTEINNLFINVNSDANALNFKMSDSSILNSQIKLDNVLVTGKLSDKTLFTTVSSIDANQNKKLLISAQITKDQANYKLKLIPEDFYLMNNRWDIAADNYIEFGKKGFLIHHLFFNKNESRINIASVHDQFNDDLNIEFKSFKLDDISKIFEKDTSLVKGDVEGNVLLKRVNNSYGLIADARIDNLFVHDIPIGNLTVKAANPTTEKFDIEINLSGNNNDVTANGYYIPNGSDNSLNIKAVVQSLSLKTVEAFSMGNIKGAEGNLTGNFLIEGKTSAPDVTGELTFNDVFLTPQALNSRLQLKHETLTLKKEEIYFNSFTILDAQQHKATIEGVVKMSHFKDFIFALNVSTNDFLLFNTTAMNNKEFFGRMIIDSKIGVKGPLSLPVVEAKIKMKKGSNFTFAVPEDKLSTDKGEDIVEFSDSLKLNSILDKGNKKESRNFALKGFDISSVIEIDKEATLRLLLDPASTDSLVVKGEAALSFTIDRSGKMSLTGAYNLNEGSYLVSLENVIKRRFIIEKGGTIIWNGDLLGAAIEIDASYSVRASPFDLIADQMSDMSETDKNQYKQRYPFIVLLKLRGEMLHPQISFEIQLPPEDKGILGGAVNAKLNMLNDDPSALNKQVFALLVLGRFIQENPLQSESNGALTIVRTTVGKFLSTQLNQLSSKFIPGVELNFDIQSYDDYQSGQAQGRTQVEIGIKKQLFNERMSVQVGGSVDVEGPAAKQNNATDIISDVTLEYKLTKDGRYLLKGFRHNQYEGAIEGQVVETGIGVVYSHDFNKMKDFFKSQSKIDSSETNKKKK